MELRLRTPPIKVEKLTAIVLGPHLMVHFVPSACANIMGHVQQNQPHHSNPVLSMDVNALSSDLVIYASNAMLSTILKMKPVIQHVKPIILGRNAIMYALLI